ncbi:hypothetical protein MPTK1_5g04470 [Marchantia polymorpha subsp. ruderalis]|uniref:Uncharacterized protein n=2 Tax=Marchantia polymorpha TaxID=3197 RepID=A0AAF6BEW9_MARPO|nr:hypothetical protein MARPO_0027s0179 [Marchantia polymorpha]BBN10553.1 hypothetical protein Mp_5g04470 [Marchantia polymorpha subsp. ruderalis]|eukprot:PTQ43082.1 hypothetical protein MARPO_0027s0179 [Marchantia polymorpha]
MTDWRGRLWKIHNFYGHYCPPSSSAGLDDCAYKRCLELWVNVQNNVRKSDLRPRGMISTHVLYCGVDEFGGLHRSS